jgi:hypothetical protein
MAVGVGNVGFGFAAGALSILSPCVLPILPLVLAPSADAHRLGSVALGALLMLAPMRLPIRADGAHQLSAPSAIRVQSHCRDDCPWAPAP